MKYKVKYRKGTASVTIESNDKAYIDKALKALGAEPKKTRSAKPKRKKAKKAVRKKAVRKKAAGKKVQKRRKSATKGTAAKRSPKAAAQPNLGRIISAVRGARNASAIRTNVLKKRDRLAKILLCYQFAKSTKQPALSTRDVEALTAKLGGKIAQPNVGKVIRLGGKRYLTAKRGDGGTAYVINARGQAALQRAIRGAELS